MPAEPGPISPWEFESMMLERGELIHFDHDCSGARHGDALDDCRFPGYWNDIHREAMRQLEREGWIVE